MFVFDLIDELVQLWSYRALTYDISRKQNFVTRSASMWTINDFPAYGMLSGWSTHGKLACPYCMENNKAFTLPNGGKASFFLLSPSFLTTRYKYHLSCTLHYHRRPYRRTHIRWYFTESWKIITRNVTLTDDFTDGLPFVRISQRVEKILLEMPQSPTMWRTDSTPLACRQWVKITDKITDKLCEFQTAGH
jgi:hypothetical protein